MIGLVPYQENCSERPKVVEELVAQQRTTWRSPPLGIGEAQVSD